jgi:hypothetical protein
MLLSRTCRVLPMALLWAGLSFRGIAQAPDAATQTWSSDTLNLRFTYPADLAKRDAAEALHDGHLMLFGISGDADPELAAATRCLRPNLLVQLPTAPAPAPETTTKAVGDGETQVTIKPALSGTILLAELDIECLTPEQQVKAHDLQASMAELVNKVPGMHSMMQPAWYTIGYQKVHVAAAQGQPQAQSDAQPGPLQVFTMAISTNWNNHLLVWYFSSNSVDMLNRMTKSTVRFGRAAAAPLYPVTMGNNTPASR